MFQRWQLYMFQRWQLYSSASGLNVRGVLG